MTDVIQRLFDKPAYATASVATNGSNASKVTITLRNANGKPVAGEFELRLSDATSGLGLTATTASGTVANDGTSGADMGVQTTKKALRVQTNSSGVYALAITDTAKTGFVIVVVIDGLVFVVATLTAASYG